MKPVFNLNYDEKTIIAEWKSSLPQKERKFTHQFIENGKYTEDGYKLYNYQIITDDNLSLSVCENVQLC